MKLAATSARRFERGIQVRPYLQASAEERQQIRTTITQVLAARPEVLVAFLFGSFLGEPRFHDVDLGIVVDPKLVPNTAALDFASDLANELEWKTRLPIDLNVLNEAPIALRYNASRGELLLSKDDGVQGQFLEQAWREYLDFEPFLRRSLQDLLKNDDP